MPNENLAPIQEISTEGFHVVSSSMFVHLPRKKRPTCTIWPNSINFNKAALTALNSCEHIRIEVNPAKKCLLIIPVTASDRDGIKWVKYSKNNFEPRKMECKKFTVTLFETWKWDLGNIYRAMGQLVTADKKVMLLFNFTTPECWRSKGSVKDDG